MSSKRVRTDGPELEAPPAPTAHFGQSVEGLFSEESLVQQMAKVSVLEQYLALPTKNIRFAEFMREALLVIMKVIQCEAGSILELDERNQSLFFRAVVGQSSDRLTSVVIPFGQGVVGHVAESRQTLLVSNVAESQVHLKSIEKAVDFDTRNLVAIPLLVRGRVYGVLELLNRIGEETFSAADVELLNQLSVYMAQAIDTRLTLGWALQQQQSTKGQAA